MVLLRKNSRAKGGISRGLLRLFKKTTDSEDATPVSSEPDKQDSASHKDAQSIHLFHGELPTISERSGESRDNKHMPNNTINDLIDQGLPSRSGLSSSHIREPHEIPIPHWDLSTSSSRSTSTTGNQGTSLRPSESISSQASTGSGRQGMAASVNTSQTEESAHAMNLQEAVAAMNLGQAGQMSVGQPLRSVESGQPEIQQGALLQKPMHALELNPSLQALAEPKYVFAHFMVGNTYPYTVDDWYADIQQASGQGIDGFVLNVGREDWQRSRSVDCFTAASRLPSSVNFKLFYSFDMTSISGNTVDDYQIIHNYFAPFATHPRMFKHPRTNGVVVSTFSGENSTFGQGRMEDGWAYVKNQLSTLVKIHFIASFFISPARYPSIPAMDGAFNWNGGWPIQLTPSSPRSDIVDATLDSDEQQLQNLSNGRTFMAAVSPWFFTHYGPDTWNKNWIYRGDDWLFVRRWEQLIQMRDRVDLVQIISWNDYGESHYIGPIKGAQPNSQAWVNGYPHEAWLSLNNYFANAYRIGSYPTIIKDQIYMWARPHPKDANAPDKVPRPDNWQLADDTLWVVVFTTAPATVKIFTTETNPKSFDVPAGMSKLSAPLQVNGGMRVTILRGGKTVTQCSPLGFRFEQNPAVYNFNAFVAMST